MKINDSTSSAVSGAQQTQDVTGGAAAAKPNRRGTVSDQVQLSSLSTQLSDLHSDSPARTSYVDGLAAMVANGSYVVDSRAVSSAILGYMQG